MIQNVKRVTTFLFSFLCLILTACVSDPANFGFDYNELKDKVVAVELINYDNPDVKTVKKKTDILPFDSNKMKFVESLDAEKLENFLSDLSNMVFHESDDLTKYSNSATGISLRIIYDNKDFVVFCSNIKSNFVTQFSNEGSVGEIIVRFIGHQDFLNLVNNHFDTKIS